MDYEVVYFQKYLEMKPKILHVSIVDIYLYSEKVTEKSKMWSGEFFQKLDEILRNDSIS